MTAGNPGPTPPPAVLRLGYAVVAALAVASLAAIGYWMLFSSFAFYDDEGYVLMSVREYLRHGGLYDVVYSQYGPAFYVLTDALQGLAGGPFDHTTARLFTLGLWLGTAVACAALVQRSTASRSLTLFTLTGTFLYLYFVTDEPFHPGSVIILVLAATVWLLGELVETRRLAAAGALAGAAAAVLVLTKINVGGLFLAGVGAWGALHSASDAWRRRAGPWVAAAIIGLGAGLMHALLREAWVQIYLVQLGVGAVTLVLAHRGDALVRAPAAGWCVAAAAGTGLALLAAVAARGTSLPGLLDGVLLGPLLHPSSYSYAVDWRPGTLAAAGVSLGLALLHRRMSPRSPRESGPTGGGSGAPALPPAPAAAADRLIVALRLGQAAGLIAGVGLVMDFRVIGTVFSFVAPLLWTWVVPLQEEQAKPIRTASRGLLAFVLLLQYLHAYPVGGSQESWGTFLLFPLFALGMDDVRRWLNARAPAAGPIRFGWPVLAGVMLAVAGAKIGWTAAAMRSRYENGGPLGLPGAGALHLAEPLGATCRIVALNAAVHADLLFSLPGMFSFNLWTDLPAPTGKNTTLWYALLDDDAQRAIIRSLAAAPHAGLIVQESLLQLGRSGPAPARGVLHDYLRANFHSVFRTGGVSFQVRNGRTVAPLNLAELGVRAGADPSGRLPDTRLEFNLAHAGAPVAAIEVRDSSGVAAPRLLLTGANAAVTVTAIDRTGRALGAAAPATWPLACRGLVRVAVSFDRHGLDLDPKETFLQLRGPDGSRLGDVRIGE